MLVHSLDELSLDISPMYAARMTHSPAWPYYVLCLMLACGFQPGIALLSWLSIAWFSALQAAATSAWLLSVYRSYARSRIMVCIMPVPILLWALGKFSVVVWYLWRCTLLAYDLTTFFPREEHLSAYQSPVRSLLDATENTGILLHSLSAVTRLALFAVLL